MGIILNQTYKNTLIIFLGFLIGGINVLFLFTHFLDDDYYGLVTFLLSTSNILMPLMVLGMQNTIVKYYFYYQDETGRDNFLITALLLPLAIIVPLGIFGALAYNAIADMISRENPIIRDYTYLIFLLAVFMGYFEVFNAWCRVQMKSVFGSFIQEVFARAAIMVLLFLVHFKVLNEVQFVYAVVIVYFVRVVIIAAYAFTLYFPKTRTLKLPANLRELMSFSFYMILAGSASTILLEIDKFMIPQMEKIAEVAYYAVGVYIASVVGVPTRAMQQIINPITARDIQSNNFGEVAKMYTKSSVSLLIAGGLLFLLINCNITELYALINKPEYNAGITVVILVSVSELIKLALGTNAAILSNSKYYRSFFYYSIAMSVSVIVLNKYLIEIMGINGAALSTLIVIFVFSLSRIMYVQKKMQMQPFTAKTWVLLGIIAVLFFPFYFVKITEMPVISIFIKSIVISILYLFLVFKFRISEDFRSMVLQFNKK